jgi:hypothetical protein
MGTTLYNKIPLGRSSVLSSRRVQAVLVAAACLTLAAVWLLVRTLK